MTRSYAEQVDSIERQMRQLRARKQEVMARHAKRMRKAEQAATFEIGRITLGCFERGWESVDYGRLAEVMRLNADVIGACAMGADESEPDKAAVRLKAFQAGRRAEASVDTLPGGGDDYEREED